ncbi:MAG: hypothetical protein P8Y02_14395 [Deinococcales bacterium]
MNTAFRKLTLAADGQNLAEGKRVFTKERLYRLADELFGVEEEAPA